MKTMPMLSTVKKWKSFFIVLFICFALSLTGCLEGLSTTMTGSPEDGNSIDAGTPTGNGATEEGTSTETELEPSTPPISIMTPSLVLPETIVYQETDEGGFPIVGQAGAVTDFDDGDQIMVSTEDLGDVLACFESPSIVRNAMNQLKNMIISEAYAETGDSCDDDYDYCPIESDGSFACNVDPGISTDTFYFAIVGSDCQYKSDEVYEDQVQTNLLYLGNTPSAVASVEGYVYALADVNGISVVEDEEDTLRVSGDHTLDYQNFQANGTSLTYSSNDSLVGVMGTDGVQLLDYDAGIITDTTETAIDENASSYTFMKPINNIIYYGFEQASSTEAHIMYATTATLYRDDVHIKYYILNNDDAGIEHTKTLAYDSRAYGWGDRLTVVAFVDNSSNIRFRVINNSGLYTEDRLDGTVWKTISEANVKDIVTYYDDDSDNIYFAILDDVANKLRVGSFTVSSETRTIDDTKVIDLDSTPAGMVYSETSGKLYVLNRTAQTVSVIPLMSTTSTVVETPVVSGTLNLSDVAIDKTINFAPNSLAIKDNRLLVTDETTKALVLIDVSAYETALE